MIAVSSPLFKLGRVVATPAALAALEQSGQSVWEFLTRHLAGDWGLVDAHDKAANEEALKDGARLLSAYRLKTNDVTIWLVTEAEDDNGNRAATTALLPDDY